MSNYGGELSPKRSVSVEAEYGVAVCAARWSDALGLRSIEPRWWAKLRGEASRMNPFIASGFTAAKEMDGRAYTP